MVFFKHLHSIALQYACSWKKYQKEVCRETSHWLFHCQTSTCVLNCTAVLYIIKYQQKEKLEGKAVERTETKKLLCGDFPITIIQDVKNIWKLFQINVQDLRSMTNKICFNDRRIEGERQRLTCYMFHRDWSFHWQKTPGNRTFHLKQRGSKMFQAFICRMKSTSSSTSVNSFERVRSIRQSEAPQIKSHELS